MTPRRIAARVFFMRRERMRDQMELLPLISLATNGESKDIRNQLSTWEEDL